jgi:hypothetical protein
VLSFLCTVKIAKPVLDKSESWKCHHTGVRSHSTHFPNNPISRVTAFATCFRAIYKNRMMTFRRSFNHSTAYNPYAEMEKNSFIVFGFLRRHSLYRAWSVFGALADERCRAIHRGATKCCTQESMWIISATCRSLLNFSDMPCHL